MAHWFGRERLLLFPGGFQVNLAVVVGPGRPPQPGAGRPAGAPLAADQRASQRCVPAALQPQRLANAEATACDNTVVVNVSTFVCG